MKKNTLGSKLRELSSDKNQRSQAEQRVSDLIAKIVEEMTRRAEENALYGSRSASWKFDRPSEYLIRPMTEEQVLSRIVSALEQLDVKAKAEIVQEHNANWSKLWVEVSW